MNTQYWEEELETMSREKLQELQLQRLKKTINIAANAPYYKEVFSKHGITADSIQSLDDIRKVPFTTKSDMRAHYPWYHRKPDCYRSLTTRPRFLGQPGSPLSVRSRNTQD